MFGQILEKSYWTVRRIIILVVVVAMLAFALFDIASNCSQPEPASTSANFQKADYSSDRNWLGCRQHQHECIYEGIGESLSSSALLDKCGSEYICDALFSTTQPVDNTKNNKSYIQVRGKK
jgi:hypothetical protein